MRCGNIAIPVSTFGNREWMTVLILVFGIIIILIEYLLKTKPFTRSQKSHATRKVEIASVSPSSHRQTQTGSM